MCKGGALVLPLRTWYHPREHGSIELMTSEAWMDPAVVQWTQRLLDSYRHWMGRDLIARNGEPVRLKWDIEFARFLLEERAVPRSGSRAGGDGGGKD